MESHKSLDMTWGTCPRILAGDGVMCDETAVQLHAKSGVTVTWCEGGHIILRLAVGNPATVVMSEEAPWVDTGGEDEHWEGGRESSD